MRGRFHLYLLLAGAAVFFNAGCAARYTPQASGNDMAYVVAKAPVWLVTIDGNRVRYIPLAKEKRYAVSPVTHRVIVAFSDIASQRVRIDNYRAGQVMVPQTAGAWRTAPPGIYDQTVVRKIRSTENIELWLNAESGHTYYVK